MEGHFSDNEPPPSEDGSTGSTPVPSVAPTTDEYVQMLQYAMMTPRGRGLHPSHQPGKSLVDVVVDFSSEEGGERTALDEELRRRSKYTASSTQKRERDERELRERELKERDLRDRELRDREIREMEMRERDMRERELREMEMREREMRERELRDREIRERELRDREIREREALRSSRQREESRRRDEPAPQPQPQPPLRGGGEEDDGATATIGTAPAVELHRLESTIDASCQTIKREILGMYSAAYARLMEDARNSIRDDREKHTRRVYDAQREVQDLHELLRTYEQNIEKKDQIIQNLTTSLNHEREKTELERQALAQSRFALEQQHEQYATRIAALHHARTTRARTFATWRSAIQNKWKHRVEQACMTRAEEVVLSMQREYDLQLEVLQRRLDEAHQENEALRQNFAEREAQLRKAFLRGVCSMNLEILSTSNAAAGEEGADIPPNVAADATAVDGSEQTIRLTGNTSASGISSARNRAEIRSLLMQRGPVMATDAESHPERAPQPQPQPQQQQDVMGSASSSAAAAKHRIQGKKHVMQTGKTFVVRHVP